MKTRAARAFGGAGSDDMYLFQLEDVEFQPVFIIGAARSGTTILYRVLAQTGLFNVTTVNHIINRHRLLQVQATGQQEQARADVIRLFGGDGMVGAEREAPPVFEEYCYVFDREERQPILNDSNLPTFMRFCKKLQVIQGVTRPLLLRNTYDTANFLYIHEKFPHARYVFIYRHPAEIISSTMRLLRSIFAQRSEPAAILSPRYDRLSQSPLKLALARAFFSDKFPVLFRQVCGYVAHNCNYMAAHKDELGLAMIGITYPDLCSHTNQVVQRILDFLGLEERAPYDYAGLIRPSEAVLLPEVQRNLAGIEQRTLAYLRAGALSTRRETHLEKKG
jgi:hypothetical protein